METQQRAAPLPPGTKAPGFALPAKPDQELALADLRGRPVVLVFYPADWSLVCSDQLALYQELVPEFDRFDAQLVGISVDGVWCHQAFAEIRHLEFPLLADFEPKGEVSRLYGVYRNGDGTSERALYVIDRDGVIRWSYVSPVGINPGADGILRALEELPA
jgi:peroxiredoxin